MNPELEKLVDIALIDGYISDKEREVLKRKAEKQGFDVDELEMILDGRLYEINNQAKPKINKCPSCGEIISGFTRVCNACDYILNTSGTENFETLEQSFAELEELVDDLGNARKKADASPLFLANLKLFFTWGLYIIYKKLIKKQHIYDSYRNINEESIIATEAEAQKLRRKYGDSPQVNDAINSLLAQRDSIIRQRRRADRGRGITGFFVMCTIFYFLGLMVESCDAALAKADNKPEKRIEKLVDEGKISEAKAVLPLIETKTTYDYYKTEIVKLEVDSLAEIKNYDEALKRANMLEDIGLGTDRTDKIDQVITKQVTELIAEKDFKLAKERTGMASYSIQSKLESQIEMAEKLK